MPPVLLFLATHWRAFVASAVLILLAVTAGIATSQRDHARAELADMTLQRDAAQRVARQNADTVVALLKRQADEMAAIAAQRAAEAARATQLETRLEALRRDPTAAAPAAPVLRDAVGRLREQRAAGTGGAAGSHPDPPAAADGAEPAPPAGPGAADAGRRG